MEQVKLWTRAKLIYFYHMISSYEIAIESFVLYGIVLALYYIV